MQLLCACGCGEQVRKRTSRFRPGHYRGPEQGEERTCDCGRKVWVPERRRETWRACSTTCARLAKSTLKPRNALQRRCWEWIRANGSTIAGLGRAADVAPDTLREWFRRKGSSTSSRTIHALADLLEISYEQALSEAGGVTADQKRAEHNRQLIAAHWPEPGTPEFFERQRRAARSPKGAPNPEHTARRLATRKATGGYQRFRDAGDAFARSPTQRVLRTLRNYVRWHAEPSSTDITRWAQQTGVWTGLDAGVVLALWRPVLRDLGLHSGAGRKRLEARCELIRTLQTEWPRSASGRIARGFWKVAQQRVETAEGSSAPQTDHDLLTWWRHHVKHCPEASGQVPEAKVEKLAATA
jgi:hypothetical protein